MAQDRRQRLWKLVRDTELRSAVVDRLKAGWSPEQIAERLRYERSSSRVCHETIYRYAYGKDGQELKLYRHLPEHRRRRRPRRMRGRRGPQIPDRLALRFRPDTVKDRREFGHWEGDLVMFRKEHGKANLTTLVERTTRFAVILPNNDRQSKPIMGQIVDGLATLPREARRSFTFDRGTEFSAWRELKSNHPA